MRADIGDRAELAAKLGIETPVPIDGKEQPILEKAAVDETGLSDHAAGDGGFGFLTQRIVAEVIGHTSDASGFLRQPNKHFRFARIHGERFFAEDMLSCAEQTAGLFEVHMIRGANMYDGHGGIGCQFVE